jgi:hypothetical protein
MADTVKLIPYNVIVQVYSTNGNIPSQNASYIEFVNCGDAMVSVEGVLIPPFGSWSPVPPLPFESDNSQYKVTFTDGAVNNWLCVTRKFYVGAVSS